MIQIANLDPHIILQIIQTGALTLGDNFNAHPEICVWFFESVVIRNFWDLRGPVMLLMLLDLAPKVSAPYFVGSTMNIEWPPCEMLS